MTFYEENLQVLAKYYPEMDKLIEEARNNLDPNLEIYQEISNNKEIILKVKKDGHFYYLGGKRDPIGPAKIWVQTLGELQTNAPIFIMGVGNPIYLRELVEYSEKRLTIIIYEPSIQIFLKFLEISQIEKWMEKHLIIFNVAGIEGMDELYMENILKKIIRYSILQYFRYLILPNYDILFTEEVMKYTHMCFKIIQDEKVGFYTRNRFSKVVVKNLLANARYLCKGYKTTQLVNIIPHDIPGIVVAAGPSLNANMQELKKAKGKAFIIAVDTAIKPLLKEGIIPDMFAIIDGLKPLNLIQVESAREIPLVTTLDAASEVLEYHKGMKFFYNEGYQFAERIFWKSKEKVGNVSCGGSVATSAFSLLYKIGINTIILVGQDLAYTNNKSHADGTFHEQMEKVNTSYFQTVEGNYEEKVPTRGDFKLYLEWYNMYIEGCMKHRPGFRVINATEGGAKIKNTEIMTLQEAIEKECTKEVNIQECLEKLPTMLDKEGQEWTIEYLKGMSLEFHKLQSMAKKLRNNYKKLDKICDKKNIDKKEYQNILKKLNNQIKQIESMDTYQLVSFTMTQAMYILRSEQFLQEDSIQKEGKEIARKGILYVENVEKMADLFEGVAKDTFENLEEQVNQYGK